MVLNCNVIRNQHITFSVSVVECIICAVCHLQVFGVVFESIKQPVINGYLVAGAVVGPGGLQLIKELVQVCRLTKCQEHWALPEQCMSAGPADLRTTLLRLSCFCVQVQSCGRDFVVSPVLIRSGGGGDAFEVVSVNSAASDTAALCADLISVPLFMLLFRLSLLLSWVCSCCCFTWAGSCLSRSCGQCGLLHCLGGACRLWP